MSEARQPSLAGPLRKGQWVLYNGRPSRFIRHGKKHDEDGDMIGNVLIEVFRGDHWRQAQWVRRDWLRPIPELASEWGYAGFIDRLGA